MEIDNYDPTANNPKSIPILAVNLLEGILTLY